MIVGVLALTGCRPAPESRSVVGSATDGWIGGPRVERVLRRGDLIVVSGTTEPLGRVVLTGGDGVVYAAGADEQGHFDVRVPTPARAELLAVKAQVGQIAYPAPYRLLIAADPSGPLALLAIGAPSRRLDAGPELDAIDSDGRSALVSGRGAPESRIAIGVPEPATVPTDSAGRWTVAVNALSDGAIRVGSESFAPPPLVPGGEDSLERAGKGWLLTWRGTGGGRQVTWFPDARGSGQS
jgi:hypothetical protein